MFKNHVAIITGAGSGFGYATAKMFIEENARVIGVDNNAETLRAVAEKLGPAFDARVCDLSEVGNIVKLKEDIAKDYDKIDILVNSAGFVKENPVDVYHEPEYDLVTGVMLKGPIFMTRCFAELLKKSENASIINIGSAGGIMKCIGPASALYGISKAALDKFTYHCVCDLPGIRCNIIHPGPIKTPIYVNSGDSEENVEATFDFLRQNKIPAKKEGTADDVANLILYLCSEKGAFINGASIIVDGGFQCCANGGMRK